MILMLTSTQSVPWFSTPEQYASARRRRCVFEFFTEHEIDLYLTFTYVNQSLPAMSKHATNLFKRMNRYCLKYYETEVAYLWLYEFGKLNGRPHLHAALDLRGIELEDFPIHLFSNWWPHGSWYPGEIHNVERLMWYMAGTNAKVNTPGIQFSTHYLTRYFGRSRPPRPSAFN
ncbi:MAG: hypothetical protein ACFFBD_10205 [Candidatus Hodarchaeota archaeon]